MLFDSDLALCGISCICVCCMAPTNMVECLPPGMGLPVCGGAALTRDLVVVVVLRIEFGAALTMGCRAMAPGTGCSYVVVLL
jgi:hypothetical protein